MKAVLADYISMGGRALLLRQLRKRFGNEVDTERRLVTASAEQIVTWRNRVLSAATLTELQAD
jgi:hypothetical protein